MHSLNFTVKRLSCGQASSVQSEEVYKDNIINLLKEVIFKQPPPKNPMVSLFFSSAKSPDKSTVNLSSKYLSWDRRQFVEVLDR